MTVSSKPSDYRLKSILLLTLQTQLSYETVSLKVHDNITRASSSFRHKQHGNCCVHFVDLTDWPLFRHPNQSGTWEALSTQPLLKGVHNTANYITWGKVLGLLSSNKISLKGEGDVITQLPIGRVKGRQSQTFLRDAQENGKGQFQLHRSGNLSHRSELTLEQDPGRLGKLPLWAGINWKLLEVLSNLWSYEGTQPRAQVWTSTTGTLYPKLSWQGLQLIIHEHEVSFFWQKWFLYSAPELRSPVYHVKVNHRQFSGHFNVLGCRLRQFRGCFFEVTLSMPWK